MSSLLPPTRTPAEIQAAFFEACQSGDLGRVQKLLAAGADPNAADQYGDTPLHWASQSGDLPVVLALLAAGAYSNALNHGLTPLHWASGGGHLPVVKALLDAGADPNADNEFGDTPLHWASQSGDLPVVIALLDAGADPRVGVPLIAPDQPSSSFVLTTYARNLTSRTPGLAEELLAFLKRKRLDQGTHRGEWLRAVVFSALGCKFKKRTTESRVEEVPEGPAVGGAGGPTGP